MATGEYPLVHCRECGKEQRAEYVDGVKERMVRDRLCFDCLFWTEYVEDKDNPKNLRIEGSHYYAGDEGSAWPFRGHGGRRYVIERFDGTRIESSNLWFQGEIPAHFRARLPDNASFVSEPPTRIAIPR